MNPIIKGLWSLTSRIRPRRDHIVIACFPKSGSTFMTKAICEITGFRHRNLCDMYNHNEQEVSAYKLRKLRYRSVIQQHFKGTHDNVRLLNEYGIRPIVNVRNIYDVILSLHDHFDREDHKACTGYVHSEYWNMSLDDRLDYLIRVHLPWYFNFFMSWREAVERIDVFPMTYERFFADPVASLKKMLDFTGIDVTTERIDEALGRLKQVNTRLNKGRSGRGDEILTDRHREAVLTMARSWGVDLDEMAAIGLGSASNVNEVEAGAPA